jgi:hypothetical protein
MVACDLDLNFTFISCGITPSSLVERALPISKWCGYVTGNVHGNMSPINSSKTVLQRTPRRYYLL